MIFNKLFQSAQLSFIIVRSRMSSSASSNELRGLVLGAFTAGEKQDKTLKLSQQAGKFNASHGGQLANLINTVGPIDGGKCRIFYGLPQYPVVAVVGLGDPTEAFDPNEGLNPRKETTRKAVANGVRALIDLKVGPIEVEDMEDAQTAAEGAYLGAYKYQAHKTAEKQTKIPEIKFAQGASDEAAWKRGQILAELQNFARVLEEEPANLMTPTIFCERIKAKAVGLNVDVKIHDEAWAREKKMGSFLSVTAGTDEPAKVCLHFNFLF